VLAASRFLLTLIPTVVGPTWLTSLFEITATHKSGMRMWELRRILLPRTPVNKPNLTAVLGTQML
jgi:hypothetical protein